MPRALLNPRVSELPECAVDEMRISLFAALASIPSRTDVRCLAERAPA